MAIRPGTACRWRGCVEITKHPSGYCQEHQVQARRKWDKETEAKRGTARERGYDKRWEIFREWFIQQAGNQYCDICFKEKGIIKLVEIVHHIIPISERPELRLVPDNCQSLCRACHEEIHGR